MNKPLISIALCTFNGVRFLREQLDSLVAQTYENFEIVIGDDASTDETRNILRAYADADSRIRLFLNDQNLGYSANFAQTMGHCAGELLAICDQDDLWAPHKLAVMQANIQNHELLYHDSALIDEQGQPMHYAMSEKFRFYAGDRPEPFLFLNCVSGHGILMKKTLLHAALPFPAAYHYDQWLAFVATTIGSIGFVNEPLVSYRQHQRNATDVLARRAVKTTGAEKVTKLRLEAEWLALCAAKADPNKYPLIGQLATLSAQRNRRFFSPAFVWLVWRHRDLLLFLLKKGEVSKFFYTLRKGWGESSKN